MRIVQSSCIQKFRNQCILNLSPNQPAVTSNTRHVDQFFSCTCSEENLMCHPGSVVHMPVHCSVFFYPLLIFFAVELLNMKVFTQCFFLQSMSSLKDIIIYLLDCSVPIQVLYYVSQHLITQIYTMVPLFCSQNILVVA